MSSSIPLLSLGASPTDTGDAPPRSRHKRSNSTSRPRPPRTSAAIPLLSLGLDRPAESTSVRPSEQVIVNSSVDVSRAIDCDNEDFNKKSFALKRTRSLGGFDGYTQNKPDLVGTIQDYPHLQVGENDIPSSSRAIGEARGVQSASSQLTASSNTRSRSPTSIVTDSEVTGEADDGSEVTGEAEYPTSDGSECSSTTQESPESIATSVITSRNTDEADYDYPSPSLSGSADLPNDDSVIHPAPQRLVDYFSHDWKESDVSSSWRYIVLRRKDVANAARLENASWRTWTKAKYNLKTVAPESVNWLKDYDVTWLYGPLYNENHSLSLQGSADNLKERAEQTETAAFIKEQAPDSVGSLPTMKPILKKKTVSEFLGLDLPNFHRGDSVRRAYDNNEASDEVESSNYLRHHNYRHRPHFQTDDAVSDTINKQYSHPHIDDSLKTPSIHSSSSSSVVSFMISTRHEKNRPSVHFNDRVDQCIAIDGYDSSDAEPVEEEEDDLSSDEEDDSENEEDGGLFLMVRSSSSTSLHQHSTAELSGLHGPKSISSISLSIGSESGDGKKIPAFHPTISVMPATRLKYAMDDEEEEARQAAEAKSIASSMMSQTHKNNERRPVGAFRTYDYNSVYTSPGPSPDHSRESSYVSSPSLEEVDTAPLPICSSRSSSSQHTTIDHATGHLDISQPSSVSSLLEQLENGHSQSPSPVISDDAITDQAALKLSINGQELLQSIAASDSRTSLQSVVAASDLKKDKPFWKWR